jgi:hypothetical protein
MPEKAIENKSRKRALKVVAMAGGLVLVGGVAFAYWTQGGSGGGSVTTDSTSTLNISQDNATDDVAPGVDVALSGTVSNGNDAAVRVGSVSASVTGVTPLGSNTCATTNYSITGTAPVNAEIAGHGSTPWSGLSLHFNNDPNNSQDGCKGATVQITYSSN